MGIFDDMAARYDTEQRAQVADIIARELRAGMGGCGDKAAVDYGCGTGLVGLQLADCFRSLLMVDASAQMVEQVRTKITAAHLPNAETLCADFSLGTPAGLYADVIFMAQVLLHIPDVGGIVKQLYRLLNPGGRLFIVDFDKDEGIVHDKVHNGFVQAQLIADVERIGFTHAQAHTFYHGQRLFMNRDASLFLLEAEKA